MGSVVVDLQSESLDQRIPVSDLLRKALVVARKLKLSEFQEWIENELSGYKKEVPNYRMVSGAIKGWNPHHGWKPLIFKDPKEAEVLSKKACRQSIAELEDLILGNSPASTLHMPYSQHIQRNLSKAINYETEFTLFIERTQFVKIIEAVRNIILNWALKLEEEGILGEGLSFSNNEKTAAGNSPQNINYFYGPVQNPQIAQGNEQAIQVSSTFQINVKELKKLISNLETVLPNLALSQDKKSELQSEIDTLSAQSSSPNPKKEIVKESLSSIRNILEGAGESAAEILSSVRNMLEGAAGSAALQVLTDIGKMAVG